MSVNPDGMQGGMGIAEEYVDLEHQVIRQKIDLTSGGSETAEALPGDPFAEFDPGERQLDREEVAQLVYYRRFASVNFLQRSGSGNPGDDQFCIVDASVGINGDLFREVTTQSTFTTDDGSNIFVDQGGEIGLLDNYTVFASPTYGGDSGAVAQYAEFAIDYYDWPTGGPIVDSFDTITCGFGIGKQTPENAEAQVELRYDFYWDVAEQGRTTNPFGRPSTR
jgi:hypothetical protein